MPVDNIQNWQRMAFNKNFQAVYQQMQPLIYPDLNPVNVHLNVQAGLDDFDILGAMIHHDVTDRHGDTVIGHVEHGRVWCRPYASDAALLLDREDKVRSAIMDPNSAHTQAIASSLIRAKDKRIIDAATGVALAGETGTSTISFNTSAYQIALGSAPNDVFTLDKIKLASGKLSDAGVPLNKGERLMYYAAGQEKALLAITQAASADFTAQRIYDSGTMDAKFWMSFTWKLIPDVTTQNADGTTTKLLRMLNLSSTTRSCLAISRSALGFSEVQNLQTFLDVRADKQHSVQARALIDNNAVRVLQNGVVEILVKEEVS